MELVLFWFFIYVTKMTITLYLANSILKFYQFNFPKQTSSVVMHRKIFLVYSPGTHERICGYQSDL